MSTDRSRVANVGVFCGARPGAHPKYVSLAGEFGTMIAQRGAGLVYGAGGSGIMRAVAESAVAGGAPVTGVIPHDLRERERESVPALQGEIFVVRSMHQRKALMYRLATGFAVLPGGLGTLDELMEAATWNQLGIHQKPIVLVNYEGFFDPLLGFLEHIVAEGFLSRTERCHIQLAADASDALDRIIPATPRPSSAGALIVSDA